MRLSWRRVRRGGLQEQVFAGGPFGAGEGVAMDWTPWSWEQPLGRLVYFPVDDGPLEVPGAAYRSEVDGLLAETWFIAMIYRAMAVGSACGTCGARLAGKLRVFQRPADASRALHLLVVARCASWRRHVHVAAVVVKAGKDTALPALRAVR